MLAQDMSDVENMIRIWRNEKSAPELLGYNDHLVSRLLARIERQVIPGSYYFRLPLLEN